jgi:hypothetical protein
MRKIILLFFIIWPLLTLWLEFKFSINASIFYVLFYGIPSIILSFCRPERIKKTLAVSTFILPFITIADYIAELTGTWFWAPPNPIFTIKIFNYVSPDALIWAFLQMYIVIMFYQYFFEEKYIVRFWDKKSKEALFITIFVFIVFILTLIVYPNLLAIPYWYLILGLFAILPAIIFEDIKYPLIFPKLLKTTLYFFYLNLIFEIIGLKMNWWSFPSKQFIGYISFFGVTFPFEEFFFWIILFSLTILSYYEYFFNRER